MTPCQESVRPAWKCAPPPFETEGAEARAGACSSLVDGPVYPRWSSTTTTQCQQPCGVRRHMLDLLNPHMCQTRLPKAELVSGFHRNVDDSATDKRTSAND